MPKLCITEMKKVVSSNLLLNLVSLICFTRLCKEDLCLMFP